MKFTLYPIYWVAGPGDDKPLDVARLPFNVTDGVRVEAVSNLFDKGVLDSARETLGKEIAEKLTRVRHALVHRYCPNPITDPITGQTVGEQQMSKPSEGLVRNIAACLRLIRPMRQDAFLMHGDIREDGTFNVSGYDVPFLHLIEVPEVQRLFKFRNCDADDLRSHAPEFLRAMRGEFWKFRMAVQFHELGHFQPLYWKARYLLWCSAIESIYTTHHPEHKGSRVAIARIKWFLGENTSIYAQGDIPSFCQDPRITIGQILGHLYELRNHIAHGDRIPNSFFSTTLRRGLNGDVSEIEVLTEGASFIVRASLLKILRDALLSHFADTAAAEEYFAGQGLTKSQLLTAKLRPT